MKWAIVGICLFFFTFSAMAPAMAQNFNRVRERADSAFAEAKREMAKLDSSQRAEFLLLVQKEMATLELDLTESGLDSSRVMAIMGIAMKYVGPLLVDDTSDPQAARADFQKFITGFRSRFGLAAADSVAVSPDTRKAMSPIVAATTLVVPSPSVPLADIALARQQANWIANCKAVPKSWPKRVGQTWTSDDGLVTFAVGNGQSWLEEQLARDKARADAGNVLARRGQESGVIQAPPVEASPVRYTQSDRDGVVYCLVAIPSILLPK